MLSGEHNRVQNYVLIFAVLIFALSYFYQVPQNPPGFYIDESSICYNAYTISVNGQDEYGESWPLYFRAFGEYKNPSYIYLLSILFRIFGPSILIARLLSASLGVIAILLLWWLAFRLSRKVFVASFVAISASLTPWLFENSRLVFEVALYPALLILFLLAVHKASTKERWGGQEVVSLTLLLTLLTYSYSIGRLFAPLLALGFFFFVSRKRLLGILVIWIVYGASLIPGFVYNARHGGALMFRFWLLTYITPQSSYFEVIRNFITHYFVNINPWAIAITGEQNVRDHVGTMGSILVPTVLLSLLGIVLVIARLRREQWWRYLLFALIVAPLPASLTVTELPQIRLIALPILLHVFMIPSLAWLTETRERWRQATVSLLFLLILSLGVVHRFQFRQAGPERWYIFDEQFPREVLPTALAERKLPIYFQDPPGKSGYVQLYWYGLLRGMPADNFVRLPAETKPPAGAVVISTAEECSDCSMLLKSINYIVYKAGG